MSIRATQAYNSGQFRFRWSSFFSGCIGSCFGSGSAECDNCWRKLTQKKPIDNPIIQSEAKTLDMRYQLCEVGDVWKINLLFFWSHWLPCIYIIIHQTVYILNVHTNSRFASWNGFVYDIIFHSWHISDTNLALSCLCWRVSLSENSLYSLYRAVVWVCPKLLWHLWSSICSSALLHMMV